MNNYIGYIQKFDKNEGFIYNLYVLRRRILEFPELIKTIYQRGIQGFAHSDSWSGDTYLAEVIFRVVSDLRDFQYGVKYEFFLDDDCKDMDTALAVQTAVYTAIIDGFSEEVMETLFDNWGTEEGQLALEKNTLALDLFKEYFFALWI